MTRLVPLQEGSHRGAFAWLTDVLPALPETKQDVWAAFLNFSRLSDARARQAVAYSSDPLVFIQPLGGVGGVFLRTAPDTITVAAELAGTDAVADLLGFERAVLHEMIHWAWAAAGLTENGETGDAFEAAAYGGPPIKKLAAPRDDRDLGRLSSRFEANRNPGATGRDTNGGWSYGLYQLSSRMGRVSQFLDFLDGMGTSAPEYADFGRALREAGGDAAARRGDPAFQQAWKQLALNQSFAEAQHRFIRFTHYDPFVARLSTQGIEIRSRSAALNDVAWSVSVQHGPDSNIFLKAWKNAVVPTDDASFIRAIYQERGRVDVYFASSNAAERAAVAKRFVAEEADALRMLQQA